MKIIRLGIWLFSVLYLAALSLLWASRYWPPEIYWLAILFQMVPLWTLYFPVGFLLVVALALKDRSIIVIHIISACMILFCIMDFKILFPDQRRADIKGGSSLRIMTCNLGGVVDTRRLKNLILRTEPDIISMQEVSYKNKGALEVILTPDKWNLSFTGGLGLASRLKIKNVETKDRNIVGGWGALITRYELEGASGRINLFNMHLDTPRLGIEAVMDNGLGGLSEIKRIAKMMYTESVILSRWVLPYRNVLITGDFNMTNANPIYRRCWSPYTDVFSRAGHGFGYTKYTRWHGVRIDHVLCDGNWKAIHSEAGPAIGSDHRPMIADIEFIEFRGHDT